MIYWITNSVMVTSVMLEILILILMNLNIKLLAGRKYICPYDCIPDCHSDGYMDRYASILLT